MRLSLPIFRLKRQARLMAREAQIPLSKALDQVAQTEGFRSWSHLSAVVSNRQPAAKLLAQLQPGDLVLLGARPGHGKTLLGLELAVEAARNGRPAFFFTLEDTPQTVQARLEALGASFTQLQNMLTLDTSDAICADYIIERLPNQAVAVIDYLQLLDQKRTHPQLTVQIQALKAFAAANQAIIIVISQIDRSFESRSAPLPTLADVRLPNPLDLSLFNKACFLHEGELRLEKVT